MEKPKTKLPTNCNDAVYDVAEVDAYIAWLWGERNEWSRRNGQKLKLLDEALEERRH